METLILISVAFIVYFIYKSALKTASNIQNEEITREINRKLIQNAKIDELYGRNPGSPVQQINKAIKDVAENKIKNNFYSD